MSKWNRILVLVLAAQVLLIMLLQLRGEDTAIGKLEPVVAGFDKDKVERIQIFDHTAPEEDGQPAEKKPEPAGKPGEKPSVDLAKKNGAWVLASHFDYPVEADKVTDVLDKVSGLRSRGPIASGKARQKQLDVADDSYQRKAIFTAGGADVTMLVGSSAGSRQTSVRLAGQDGIHGVTGLTSHAVGTTPSFWVNTSYVDFDADKIASIDLVNPNGSFHFEHPASGDGWQASVDGQPLALPAGMELNKSHVDLVTNRAYKMYLSEPADPKRAVDKPLATITLRLKPEPKQPAAGAADAGAAAPAESSLDEAGAEHVIEIAAAEQKDRYYVREKGRAQAALVEALSVTDLIELKRDRLFAKIADNKPDPVGGAGLPPGMGGDPHGGLPPGLVPPPGQP